MVFPGLSGDLYHKYRPRRFSEMTGHKAVVKSLKTAINSKDSPQAYLLVGESGTGKTSSARIMALTLNCTNKIDSEPCLECPACKIILSGSCSDVIEINGADNRGIDDMRAIISKMFLTGMQVSKKVYIIDECQQLTKEAQSSLLKPLEDTPEDVYIILCTTNPEKILLPVKNRCQIVKFNLLPPSEIMNLLEEVSTYEAKDLGKEILKDIAEASQGSPRNALVRLQQIIQLNSNDPEEISVFLENEEYDNADLSQLLACFFKQTEWDKIIVAYKEVIEKGAPTIGMGLAGFFRNKLLGSQDPNQAKIYADLLELFVNPFDDGKPGENKLVLNLYKAYKLNTLPKSNFKGPYKGQYVSK